MRDCIHLFTTEAEFNSAYTSDDYFEPWLSYTKEDEHVGYNKTEEEKLPEKYLTFEILSAGSITWKKANANTTSRTIRYRKNNGEWTDLIPTTGGVSFSVVTGDIVEFKGNNSGGLGGGSSAYYSTFSGTSCVFKVSGNIMSLCFESGFSQIIAFSNSVSYNAFAYLFSGLSGLTDASKLVLPLQTIPNRGYASMFYGCVNLTKPPKLPAVNSFGDYCYNSMFRDCTSLTTAPELPSLSLSTYCYAGMFKGCTGLTTAPELPAMTVRYACYDAMFQGCTSLTTAPELPATTLTTRCYELMFSGCTSLNYIKCLATDISADRCLDRWVSGVPTTSSGTFVKEASMSSWSRGTDGIPNNWTVVDA